MDYMNLGVKSRKTGISVRDGIARDKFDMEDIDDFFKENVSVSNKQPLFPSRQQWGLINSNSSSRRKRRQSSLFSRFNNGLSSPHIMSPSVHRFHSPLSKSNSTDTNNTITTNHTTTHDMLNSIYEEEEDDAPDHRNKKKQRAQISWLSKYQTSYGLNNTPVSTTGSVSSSIKPTPRISPPPIIHENEELQQHQQQHLPDNSWLKYDPNPYIQQRTTHSPSSAISNDRSFIQPPDLTNNEMTMDNTSLVTSDDAVLESELSSSEDDDDDNDNNSLLQYEGDGDADATYIPSSPIVTGSPPPYAGIEEEKEQPQQQLDNVENNNNPSIRKSDRIKVPTLEYWRNEKIIYKRKNQAPALDIVKIVTYDNGNSLDSIKQTNKEDNRLDDTTQLEYDSVDKEKASGDDNSSKPTRQYSKNLKLTRDLVKDTRNGSWINDGEFKANILPSKKSNTTRKEIVAYAPGVYQMEKVKKTEKEKYSLAITFDKHKDLFASGMLKLPINGKRTATSSQNAFITFYLIKGILEVTINKQKFITTSGSSFQIPAFNKYAFENKGYHEVQMFFVQVMVPKNFNHSLSVQDQHQGHDQSVKRSSNRNASDKSSDLSSSSSVFS